MSEHDTGAFNILTLTLPECDNTDILRRALLRGSLVPIISHNLSAFNRKHMPVQRSPSTHLLPSTQRRPLQTLSAPTCATKGEEKYVCCT